MTMPSSAQQPTSIRVAENPEVYAGSLAHVVHREQGKSSVVGQAWLAGANKLVTCGHVVEPFLKDSSSLLVKFPASGAEYTIDSVKLHPSFGRQDDQLLKFDAAVLSVRLRGAELASTALPLRFDQDLKNQETLWTVRYPAHLGALTSAPDPLQQSGHFLGRLRKQDNFHLLHDLALSPGDSGAALFSNQGVVGIHCGDTASLPGLNLPTTSIRLALWVDALKDLGIQRNVLPVLAARKRSLPAKILIGTSALAITVGACFAGLAAIYQSQVKANESGAVGPVFVSFKRVTDKGDRIGSAHIKPTSPCRLYLVFKKADKTFVLYGRTEHVDSDELDVILPEDLRASWQSDGGSLFLIAVPPNNNLISSQNLPPEGKTVPILNDDKSFWDSVKEEQKRGAICQKLTPTASENSNSSKNSNNSDKDKTAVTSVKKSDDAGKSESAQTKTKATDSGSAGVEEQKDAGADKNSRSSAGSGSSGSVPSKAPGKTSGNKSDQALKPDKTEEESATVSSTDQGTEVQQSSEKSP